jgi:hypothetical protein
MNFTSSCISLPQVLSHRPLLRLAYSDQLILFVHHLYVEKRNITERYDKVSCITLYSITLSHKHQSLVLIKGMEQHYTGTHCVNRCVTPDSETSLNVEAIILDVSSNYLNYYANLQPIQQPSLLVPNKLG